MSGSLVRLEDVTWAALVGVGCSVDQKVDGLCGKRIWWKLAGSEGRAGFRQATILSTYTVIDTRLHPSTHCTDNSLSGLLLKQSRKAV